MSGKLYSGVSAQIGDVESVCLNIQIEQDDSSEEVLAIKGRLTNTQVVFVRVYGISSIKSVEYFNTLGSISKIGSRKESITEEITITSGSGNPSKPVDSLSSWQKTGGNIPSLIAQDGSIVCPINPDDAPSSGFPPGNGTAKVVYVSTYYLFKIESYKGGKGLFLVDDLTAGCGYHTFEYDFEDIGPAGPYEITFIYQDFVTGEYLPGVKVWVNGASKGTTDSNGEVLIKNLQADVQYSIRALKAGYLHSESDSLANDTFKINPPSES